MSLEAQIEARLAIADDEDVLAAPAVLTLPIPPSLNAMLSGPLRDRIRRKNVMQWEAVAAWHEALKPTFSGPVRINARFYFRDKRRRDRENYAAGGLKAMIDALVKLDVIERDDAAYLDLRVEMLHDPANPRLELEIREDRTA